MKVQRQFNVAAPPPAVGRALCSEAFNAAAELDRPEVLETRQVTLHQDEQTHQFELRSTEYARRKTGGLDKKKTVQSVTQCTYRAADLALSWVYKGVGSRWVSVTGVYRLAPDQQGTRVTHDIDIRVHIPLLGNQIAKIVAREFDAAAERFERLLSQHAAMAS